MHVEIPSDQLEYCAFVHDTVAAAELLHVFGDMDIPNDASFETSVERAIREGRDLIIDFSGCTYMGAAGLSVLIRAHAKHGDRIRLVAPAPGIVTRLFAIAKMRDLFRIDASLESAVTLPEAPYPKLERHSNVTNIDGTEYLPAL